MRIRKRPFSAPALHPKLHSLDLPWLPRCSTSELPNDGFLREDEVSLSDCLASRKQTLMHCSHDVSHQQEPPLSAPAPKCPLPFIPFQSPTPDGRSIDAFSVPPGHAAKRASVDLASLDIPRQLEKEKTVPKCQINKGQVACWVRLAKGNLEETRVSRPSGWPENRKAAQLKQYWTDAEKGENVRKKRKTSGQNPIVAGLDRNRQLVNIHDSSPEKNSNDSGGWESVCSVLDHVISGAGSEGLTVSQAVRGLVAQGYSNLSEVDSMLSSMQAMRRKPGLIEQDEGKLVPRKRRGTKGAKTQVEQKGGVSREGGEDEAITKVGKEKGVGGGMGKRSGGEKRCNRKDGRGWQCPRRCSSKEGASYCEHHMVKLQANHERSAQKMAEEKEKKKKKMNASEMDPPSKKENNHHNNNNNQLQEPRHCPENHSNSASKSECNNSNDSSETKTRMKKMKLQLSISAIANDLHKPRSNRNNNNKKNTHHHHRINHCSSSIHDSLSCSSSSPLLPSPTSSSLPKISSPITSHPHNPSSPSPTNHHHRTSSPHCSNTTSTTTHKENSSSPSPNKLPTASPSHSNYPIISSSPTRIIPSPKTPPSSAFPSPSPKFTSSSKAATSSSTLPKTASSTTSCQKSRPDSPSSCREAAASWKGRGRQRKQVKARSLRSIQERSSSGINTMVAKVVMLQQQPPLEEKLDEGCVLNSDPREWRSDLFCC